MNASLPSRKLRWRQGGGVLLGSLGLIAALAGYCELCSLANGLPAPGLSVSGPWALQIALGWILVGAALPTLGPRIANSRFALAHPYVSTAGSILAITVIPLSCETLLAMLSGDQHALLPFVHARGPMSLAASALLVTMYVADRIRMHARESRALPSEAIEVMTGTGRTSIRIEHVECLQADRNYINVVHSSGREYLLRQTMSVAERSLDPARFVRIHRSLIVNRDFIKERRANSVLVLRSGRTVKMSRAYRDRL